MVLLRWLLVLFAIYVHNSFCQDYINDEITDQTSTSPTILPSASPSVLTSHITKKLSNNFNSTNSLSFNNNGSNGFTSTRRPLLFIRTWTPTTSSSLSAAVTTELPSQSTFSISEIVESSTATQQSSSDEETSTAAVSHAFSTTVSSVHDFTTSHNLFGAIEELDETTTRSETTFNFHVKPYSKFPSTMLELTYTPLSKYRRYRLNYVDVSGEDGSTFKTQNTTIVNDNPFIIQGLHPGHKYTLEFIAQSSGEKTVSLGVAMEMTDPVAPKFRSNSTFVDTKAIRLIGDKEPDALQDYYIISWQQLETASSAATESKQINVTDIRDQTSVDFGISNLNAGRNYNITITPYRAGRPGQMYKEIISTLPLPPTNVRVMSNFNIVNVSWDPPLNSGVDRYVIKFLTLSSPHNITEFNPAEPTSAILNVNLKPGERFVVMVYSVKAAKYSSPYNITTALKPLPPTDLSITPDFDRGYFVIKVATSGDSIQDTCYMQYVSEEPSSGRRDAHNESTPVVSSTCHWIDLPLKPGQSYHMQIWTMSNNTASDVLPNSSITIEPAFDVERFGINVEAQESSFEIKWDVVRVHSLWRGLVGENGNISVSLFGDSQVTKMISPLAVDSSKISPSILFDGLVSGRCYSVQVYSTVAGIVSRNRTRLSVRTIPATLVLSQLNVTANSVTVSVKPTSYVHMDQSCRVVLLVKDPSNTSKFNRTYSVTPQGIQGGPVRIDDLKPFTKYDVEVTHFCGVPTDECGIPSDEKHRKSTSIEIVTAQGAPGPVLSLSVVPLTPYSANLRWDHPEQKNGIITNYVVMIKPEPVSGEAAWNFTTDASVNKVDVQNLTGGYTYSFDVRAQTEAGLGQSVVNKDGNVPSVKMLIWAPPKPTGRPEILSNTVRETYFSIRFNLTMLSTRHGLLSHYAIIVAEEDARDLNTSLSWYDVRSMSEAWPAYLAVVKTLPHLKTFDSTPVAEVVGIDDQCSKEPSTDSHISGSSVQSLSYCNGPLRPGRHYRVKLRAYTMQDLYADSEYSDIVTTNAEGGSTAGTAVAVILALLVLLAFVLGVLLFLRGRGVDPVQTCLKTSTNFLTPDCIMVANGQANGIAGGGGGGNRRQRSLRERTGIDGRLDKLHNHSHHLPLASTVVPTTNPDMSRPVRKTDFAEHVRIMSADSDFRFSEEYEDLKQVGRSQLCNAADLPCNRNKNRFTNILPFDHSRVKLIPVDDEEGSDFVNASYIPAYNSPREFIATQGPLPSTRDDFWRMVWEQNSPAIVNLTRCIEKGREKCDQYWPIDSEPICYGDIEVVVMNETRFPDWTIREFKVVKGDQSRTVRHFHFTAWPDFGVPERPQALIKFVRAFRFRTPPDTRPIVVHCSAGVGRSGTFIALDRLLQHIQHSDLVDIYGIVYEMRKERVCMVQTEQQYICIHQCLLCVLEGRENENSPYLFPRPAHGAEVHQNPAFEDDEGIAESGV